MSDFLKKLKGLFVEDIPGNEKKPQNAPPPVSQPQTQPAASPTHVGNMRGAANEKFNEILLGAITAANREGFDYIEFKQSIKNLQNVPMDEGTRFKSAYAMAQTMGATKEKLSESAQYYLDVLQTETKKFNDAADRNRVQQVGNREAERQNTEAVIAQKKSQIEQLNQEIAAHEQSLTQIKRDISESTAKLDLTIADFAASHAQIREQIERDMALINIHL